MDFLYIYIMKKINLLLFVLIGSLVYGQFSVQVRLDTSLGTEAILSKLDGSKYVILTSQKGEKNFRFKVKESYRGMMKIYWPETNQTLSFISEDQDVEIALKIKNQKIDNVRFVDASNQLMNEVQERQHKNEYIAPALTQIKPFYKENSDFYQALVKEMNRLGKPIPIDAEKHPFVNYYHTNYKQYIAGESVDKKDLISFISSTNEMLETSTLLRPLLINYLNQSKANIDASVDELLDAVQVDTPRGQTVLSELIELFSSYGMETYEKKYLERAKGLKCTINDRLSSTIKVHKATEIGAVLPNYKFTKRVQNTTAKTLHDVKADKKIIVIWSSTCGHCKKDLPQLLENYQKIKAQNIKIVGLSVDADKAGYEHEIKPFPWINDAELRGWNSTYADAYNINGTPTYFILDKDNKIIAKPNRVGDVLNYLKIK